jgi:hypothetical protein
MTYRRGMAAPWGQAPRPQADRPQQPAGEWPSGLRTVTRRLALAGLAAFVAIVLAQHVLAPELGPDRHTISEYANADAGALMVAGFLSWAASLLATAALVVRDRRCARPAARVSGAALLATAAAGMLLTALFATQTSAGVLPAGTHRTTAGQIHDVASGAASLALFGAMLATLLDAGRPRWLRRLCAALLVVAISSAGVLLAVGDSVDGIRQRVLVAAACTWQAALVVSAGPKRLP